MKWLVSVCDSRLIDVLRDGVDPICRLEWGRSVVRLEEDADPTERVVIREKIVVVRHH
jgi:hypothetical protein